MWYWVFLICCKSKWRCLIDVSFIISLIRRTGKIWYVVYINAKLIYPSENLAFTIRECAIVRNVLHVTSICSFVSWCSGAANVKWTPQVWRYYLNSVEVNCFPASDKMPFKSHHPDSFIFFRYGLEHIQLIHNLFCCDFLHTIKFWNFIVGINS